MKKIATVLSLLIIISSVLWANGGSEILPNLGLKRIEESTIDRINDDGELTLSAISADIEIFRDNTSDTVSAILTGHASYSIELNSNGSRSSLSIETDRHNKKNVTTKDLKLEIHLPRTYYGDIHVETISGSITFPAGKLTDVYASTTSGEIYLSDIETANITLQAVSGDIEAIDIISESLGIHTTSGEIDITAKITDTLIAAAVSGDIEVKGTAETFNVSTTSGEIELDVLEIPKKIDTSSISGEIEITIPKNLGVKGSVSSVSGDKNIRLPLAQISGGSKKLEFSAPGNTVSITASTISGDITIQESR